MFSTLLSLLVIGLFVMLLKIQFFGIYMVNMAICTAGIVLFVLFLLCAVKNFICQVFFTHHY